MAKVIVSRVKSRVASGFHKYSLAASDETAQFCSWSHALTH